ncbi:MAG: twin transmembrane helix small protein [Betaproteobacteria bacterium]|nr:MAG: twin transmembrane helix small protein [Betaproteobacteria bacterium]
MKIVILLAFVAILGALASAGWFMMRHRRDSERADSRMAKALAWRIGLSLALFLFILLSYKLGWIRPTGLPVGS